MVAFTGERIHAGDEDFRPDWSQHLAAYRASLPLVRGKAVLDAGCGDARGTGALASSARFVVGVDASWETLRGAASGPPANLSVCAGDARALPFPDAAFDAVCAFQLLEHFPRPASFLREAARVLRAGGRLVLTTPNRLRSFSENPYHVREYAPEELRKLVSAWFSSVEVLGVFGNERARALLRSRRRHVGSILSLDPLGLRRLLPESVRKRAFAMLARRVRSRMRSEHRELFEGSAISDYSVERGDVARSLDLYAVCEK